MKLIYFTDTHWCDEECFFVAAKAMSERLLDKIKEIGNEPFIVIHGGDVFKRSKETGRVNGLVMSFFTSLVSLDNCERVIIVQGNHDVKKETGSALDCLTGISRVEVVYEPEVKHLWDNKYVYLLPYMVPYSFENYKTPASYGNPDFHKSFLIERKPDEIILTCAHVGDETGGEFFSQADLSFLPGIKCHGHVHKRVSKHYVGSAMITKRDEIDQESYLRVFDHDFKTVDDVPIGASFNYLKVNFNDDLSEAFNDMKVKPYGSMVVDVKGHDNDEAVNQWFEEQKRKFIMPIFLGSLYPDDKVSDSEHCIDDGEEKQEMNIREIFAEFCKEHHIPDSIKKRIEGVL